MAYQPSHRQPLGSVALIQLGLFLSGTLAYIIGAAWTNVVQSDFDSIYAKYMMTGVSHVRATSMSTAVQQKNLRYAIGVTLIGLLVIIGWTVLVQQIDPNLVPVPR